MGGMIGDFLGGAGAVGAQMSMDALRSQIEEERTARMTELQNRLQVARDEADRGFRRGERVAGQEFQTTTAATTRTNALADAPVLARVKTDAEVEGERRKRELPPPQVSQEEKDERAGRADYLKANAERLRAETDAIRRGERYGARGTGTGEIAEQRLVAQQQRQAATELANLMKPQDGPDGKIVVPAEVQAIRKGFLGPLARANPDLTPSELAARAFEAPIPDRAAAAKQAETEYVSAPRAGLIFGRSDVRLEDGSTLGKADFVKKRADEILSEQKAKLADWAKSNGVALDGDVSGNRQAPDPEAVLSRAVQSLRGGVSESVLLRDLTPYVGEAQASAIVEKAKRGVAGPAQAAPGMIGRPAPPASAGAAVPTTGAVTDLTSGDEAIEKTDPQLRQLGVQMRLFNPYGNSAEASNWSATYRAYQKRLAELKGEGASTTVNIPLKGVDVDKFLESR